MSYPVSTVKKRDVLKYLNSAIVCLSNMSADAAKLELFDNDQASRRLKQSIVEFTHGELKGLKDVVADIRNEINNKSNKIKTQKQNTNESESTESDPSMERTLSNFKQSTLGATETEF